MNSFSKESVCFSFVHFQVRILQQSTNATSPCRLLLLPHVHLAAIPPLPELYQVYLRNKYVGERVVRLREIATTLTLALEEDGLRGKRNVAKGQNVEGPAARKGSGCEVFQDGGGCSSPSLLPKN